MYKPRQGWRLHSEPCTILKTSLFRRRPSGIIAPPTMNEFESCDPSARSSCMRKWQAGGVFDAQFVAGV